MSGSAILATAKPPNHPHRPIIPFEKLNIGQLYSAAIDITHKDGTKHWGVIKHRILVVAKDKELRAMGSVYNSSNPKLFLKNKKRRFSGAQRAWHYLPTPDTAKYTSIATYDVVTSSPPVIKGFVNFARRMDVLYHKEAMAYGIPEAQLKPNPEGCCGFEPVYSPVYILKYTAMLPCEFELLPEESRKAEWTRIAARMLKGFKRMRERAGCVG